MLCQVAVILEAGKQVKKNPSSGLKINRENIGLDKVKKKTFRALGG